MVDQDDRPDDPVVDAEGVRRGQGEVRTLPSGATPVRLIRIATVPGTVVP